MQMHAMRPPARLLVCLLFAAAVAPPAAAVCVPRKPGASGKPWHPAMPTPVPSAKATPPPPPPKKPPPPALVAPGADIVKRLCQKTDYPDLCVSSVANQTAAGGNKSPPPQDGAGVLRLAMGAVRAKAAEAKKAATALAADPKTQPLARGPLQDCVESYDDIAYSLDHAEKAVAAGDRDSAGTMLDTVRTDVDTCDQGFEEREELQPLMAKEDALLAKLASNCLAIASAAGLR